LNSAYARLRADAIAGLRSKAPGLCGDLLSAVILWSQTSV